MELALEVWVVCCVFVGLVCMGMRGGICLSPPRDREVCLLS